MRYLEVMFYAPLRFMRSIGIRPSISPVSPLILKA
jgi:hypothetical protein